jgi:hypothetical protein
VFIKTLRSHGYSVVKANTIFGEGTDDEERLSHCADEGHVFITNDKKDFSSMLAGEIDHAGILIYTDVRFLRDHSDKTVQLIEYVFGFYSPEELEGERVWLDQWREQFE